jgi:hypothetical protein
MGIVERRIDLVVRLGGIRSLIVNRLPGSRSAGRVAIYPAIEAGEPVIEAEDLAEAPDREGLAEAIAGEDLVEAQALGLGMFRGAATVEAGGAHSGEDLEDSADQAHAPAAVEVPPAWDREVVAGLAVAAAVAAAVEGGGRHGRQT